MNVIGITGTLGAGKGTIVDYLVQQKGFIHFSARGFLIEEIERRGLKVDRDSMTTVANELRHSHSPSYIIDQLYERAIKTGKPAVIESIRTFGEITSLRQKGHFLLLAVDADPKIRYKRIAERASETDKISFETFIANEKREMTSDDPNKQNLERCIREADYLFINNGTIFELIQQVETVLQKVTNGNELQL
ncbi:MAG: AAA family ATPase [Lentimicrobiaceae bacterium]|jgi:dephospho-CoA kinase|nr:AAA family ATPase [Lentimicrobiaceae bacterium]